MSDDKLDIYDDANEVGYGEANVDLEDLQA